MVGEFEPFYLDLSHKLRHHAALALTVPGENGLRGCAVVSSISAKSAILSALAVREDWPQAGNRHPAGETGGGILPRPDAVCLSGAE